MNRNPFLLTLACVLVLFGVNFYVARDLFHVEWLRHMGSAEGAFIGIARFALKNWPNLTWFPLWYGGIPYQNTYPPLLHLTVAAVAALLRISPALSYHAVCAAVYCAGPVTLFWMAYRLSGNRGRSFCAALLYSLISPSLLLVRALRDDTGGALGARRFYSIVFYGDTPHLAALALVPVAIVMLHRALTRRTRGSMLLAAAALAAAPMTNWIGAFAQGLAVVAYLIAQSASVKDWARTVLIAAAAYLAVSPWIPPSTLNEIRTNSYWMSAHDRVEPHQLLYWIPLLLSVGALLYAGRRLRLALPLRFALLLTLLAGWITLAYFWLGRVMIPQPDRYHIELDMALCLLVAFGLAGAFGRLPVFARWFLVTVMIVAGAAQARAWRRIAKEVAQPGDAQATMEYKTAHWFEQHLPGERVMSPGSAHVFLNAFTDVPQLSGGFDQGITNIMVPNTIHLFYKGWNEIDKNAEVTILLLKALGVHAAIVGGQDSRDFFRPQEHSDRFAASGMPELWREGDDTIYGIPSRSHSLAHVIAPEDVVKQRPYIPFSVDEVRKYVAALENPMYRQAEFIWLNPHQARVIAELSKGQVLSVQISHHPGWRATIAGQPRRVHADGLGQMVIDPECAGQCEVDLTYDGGVEMTVAKIVSYSTILLAIAWALRGAGPRPAPPVDMRFADRYHPT
jgi:hypothetical protein